MGLLDAVSDVASKATSVLDAATGGAKTGTSTGAAEFVPDESLTAAVANSGNPAAPAPVGSPKSVALGLDAIEFIHVGQVHADTGKTFVHNSFDPKTAVPPAGRAIMFRDALEREAILLFGFVSSCKIAVTDTTKNRGAVEEIGALASNLMGGGNKTSKPDPTQLDTFIGKIKTETGKVNVESILYKDTHETGKQLHMIRADYNAFCESLDAYYLKPPKSEGVGAIGDAIGSAAANIPGVGKIFAVVQRIAFKFLDLYLAAFLELRKNHEKQIEVAIHKLTLEAIKSDYAEHVPTFPVWFKKPEPGEIEETADEADEAEEGDDGNSISTKKYTDAAKEKVEEKVDAVKEKAEAVKKKGEKIRDSIYDFAGASGAPDETPASAHLKGIFSVLKGPAETTAGATPGAADCIIKGLDATLSDIGGVPKFMKTVIKEIMAGNIALLEDVFARLMANDAAAPINSQLLLDGGRHYLTDRITKAFTKLIFGMITGKDDLAFEVPMGGKTLSAQQLLSKQMDERLGKYVEPVLQLCIGDLAGQLEASRAKAAANQANTMEVLLGRLPWLVAMMFRNTFFPIWNLVAEEAMGKISPPLKSALAAINSPINKAKDVVDKAEEYNRRAEETKKQAEEVKDKASNVGVGLDKGLKDFKEIEKEAGEVDDAAKTQTEEGKQRDAARAAAEAAKENLDKFYEPNDKDKEFPVTDRKPKGEGVKVEEEIPSVLPETAEAVNS